MGTVRVTQVYGDCQSNSGVRGYSDMGGKECGPGTVRVTLHSKVEARHDMAQLDMSDLHGLTTSCLAIYIYILYLLLL